MIAFDLRCGGGHVFEAWFASSAAYEAQRADGLLSCPVCGDARIGKAVMAPNIAARATRDEAATPALPAPLARLAALQAATIKDSTWVGRDFAARARAMHEGAERHAPIHGEASAEEARALIADGAPVAPLLIPFCPPSARN